jgi:ubiquitin-associated protein 1
VAFEDYNFDLEHKIISKTSEWIHWRAREKAERQERIHQRDSARLKRLEEEQKQKLNQVSYPSSDEEEDDELANEATNSQIIPREKPFSPTNFNTILMPTQATMQEKKSHRRYASNSSNKIDFSFFESDTSPFDHLEMKSMNEMEVLAQVLGSTPVEGGALERDNSSESESSDQKDNNNVTAPSDPPQVVQQPAQQFQSYVPYNNYYAAPTPAYYNYPAATNNYGHVNHQNQFLYPQQNYAVNYQYPAVPNNNNTIENGTDEKINPSSKSKSVPSILKELNDELNNSQRRRIRNNSQNSPKEVTEGEFWVTENK